jgi:hypothetical protein
VSDSERPTDPDLHASPYEHILHELNEIKAMVAAGSGVAARVAALETRQWIMAICVLALGAMAALGHG